MKVIKYEISQKTILVSILTIVGLCVLWQLRSIIFLLFFCLLLTEIFNPTIKVLEKNLKLPRFLAIIILYTGFIALISFSFAGLIPMVIEQTKGFISALPSLANNINNIKIFKSLNIDTTSQIRILNNIPNNITQTAVSIFTNLFTGLLVLVITFYMLLERKNVDDYINHIFGTKGVSKAKELMDHLELRLGHWVNAQLLLMLIVGILSYIGYLIIGINYALPLAIVGALTEIIPNIGPVFTTILAAIVGFSISPIMGIFAIIVGVIVQQFENNFLVPKVMKITMGLRPVLTLIILLVGAKLGGLAGAVLSIPVYLIFESIYIVFIKEKIQRNR